MEDKIEERVMKMKMMSILVVKELLVNSNERESLYYIFSGIMAFYYI
jgi:hypothetical protein